MHPVEVLSHYDLPVIIEQCPECGGLWFDEMELGRAKSGEAEKIDPVDTETLNQVSFMSTENLNCPRDGTDLVRFQDPFFPPEIILERCSSCNGTWLNRGEFTRFQQFRKQQSGKRESEAPSAQLRQGIEKLLEVHESGGYSRTLEKLGSFLSSPVENYPLDLTGASGNSSPAGGVAATALNIVIALLRAFVLRC